MLHTEPLTLRNLSGIIPPITIKCRRTAKQQFALQIIDCARGTIFESVEIEGDVSPDDIQDWRDNAPDGITDLSGCIFKRVIVRRVNLGFAQRAEGSVIEYMEAHEISGDMGITLADNCRVDSARLFDGLEIFDYHTQHRDVWQVAKGGGIIRNVHLSNITSERSSHKLSNKETQQGILFTDCTAEGCSVKDCSIQGGHPVHGITLGAAIGCTLSGNSTDAKITVGWGNTLNYDNNIQGNMPEVVAMTFETVEKKNTPRGIRNNNPGNVEHSDANKWLGLSNPPSDGRFCIFDTVEHGIRALALLLLNYQTKHRLKTVTQIIGRYAPRHDNNATDAYINHVAKAIGVTPKQAISVRDFKTVKALVEAIIEFENGQQPYDEKVIIAGIAYAGIATDKEVNVGTVKPVIKSTEQIAVAVAGTGTVGAGAIEWLKTQIEANQTQVIDGLKSVGEQAATGNMLGWLQLGIGAAILGSIWYLAWRRGEANFLGIR